MVMRLGTLPEAAYFHAMKLNARIFLPALAALVFAGCATATTHWDSQVGQLTYPQAVEELGPPAKESQTADGRMVAEWISRHPAGPVGLDNDFRYTSAAFGTSPTPANWRESKLCLTFDTNSILTGWSKD
jgi:hypothetical protein